MSKFQFHTKVYIQSGLIAMPVHEFPSTYVKKQ